MSCCPNWCPWSSNVVRHVSDQKAPEDSNSKNENKRGDGKTQGVAQQVFTPVAMGRDSNQPAPVVSLKFLNGRKVIIVHLPHSPEAQAFTQARQKAFTQARQMLFGTSSASSLTSAYFTSSSRAATQSTGSSASSSAGAYGSSSSATSSNSGTQSASSSLSPTASGFKAIPQEAPPSRRGSPASTLGPGAPRLAQVLTRGGSSLQAANALSQKPTDKQQPKSGSLKK